VRRLTYCTNIHPGESWADVRANLESHLIAVKAGVSPTEAFPIGLRLSAQAVDELTDEESRRFREWCEVNDLYVLTVNGFPYGRFHGTSVKERVYEPDWRSKERVAYTRGIADRLVEWLPEGVPGSISTAPIAFTNGFAEDDWPHVRANVRAAVEHLDDLAQRHGRSIVLAFEPESACVVETTEQAVELFDRLALPPALASRAGLCFDCCHQAVEFEDPAESLRTIQAAGIVIGKVQVSSALHAHGEEIERLLQFDEPTYLHQVVARDVDGALHRAADLPEFFGGNGRGRDASTRSSIEECRVHFHVPIFAEHLGPCGTTRFFLEDVLPRLDPAIPLEVETYSFDVLPEDLRMSSVGDSIVRELRWARQRIDASHGRP